MAASVVASVTLLVLAAMPVATARTAITYHGTIDSAVCQSGQPLGAITGTWNVNVTRAGEVTYLMFEDGDIHAVVTPAYGWTRVTDAAPWTFVQSFGPGIGANLTVSENPVTWTLHIWGVSSCPNFWAYGTGFVG
jgi:hypothetical protein